MKLKAVSGIKLTLLLLVSMLTLAFNIQPVTPGSVTIIVPDDYEKIQWAVGNASDGDTIFVKAGTYYENVVVNETISLIGESRETTIIDGNGSGDVVYITAGNTSINYFTIQNSGPDYPSSGIHVYHSSGHNISNNIISNNFRGFFLEVSSNNTIFGNIVTANSYDGIAACYSSNYNNISGNIVTANSYDGLVIWTSAENYISGNTIANNGFTSWGNAIKLSGSSENIIHENNMANNYRGMWFDDSSNNLIFHNNFADNTIQVYNHTSSANVWDNGYPSSGNYWSDYDGVDLYSGPYQNETGSDGIEDTSYVIDTTNQDNYPLMEPYYGPVRNLNTGQSYPTIQEAINNATAEDRILALSGAYHEHLVVNKTVSLIGEDRNSTIIDGSEVWLSTVVNITANNVTVRSFKIQNGYHGIYLFHSNFTTISNNIIIDNEYGILVDSSNGNTIYGNLILSHNYDSIRLISSENNSIQSNSISDSVHGLFFHHSDRNIILHNVIATNRPYGSTIAGIYVGGRSDSNNISNNAVSDFTLGIVIGESFNNTLRHNKMTGNEHDFKVWGSQLNHFVQDIDTSNTVNGKPIYYWVSHHGEQIPHNAGFIGVVNSSNITIRDVDLTGFGPVLLAYTTNSLIQNVTVEGVYSISLISSLGNTLINNTVVGGIYLYYSNENTIGNTLVTSDYHDTAIRLFHSERNTLSENTILKNNFGISLSESNDNNICDNLLQLTRNDGVGLGRSTNNLICRNTILSNPRYGIYAWDGSDNNTIYHNNFINNTAQISSYESMNTWDNGYPSGGNYWSDYSGIDKKSGPNQHKGRSDGIGDTPYVIDENNQDRYPLMNPWSAPDIAVINITLSKTIIGQGFTLQINATVTNQGNKIEAFNVTGYANKTVIQTESIILRSERSKTISFTWNTTSVSVGNYIISTRVTPLPSETDTDDNTYVNGEVVITITGDVNGDFSVETSDLLDLSKVYGYTPEEQNWNPNCDLNNDNKIDASDLFDLGKNYGKTV